MKAFIDNYLSIILDYSFLLSFKVDLKLLLIIITVQSDARYTLSVVNGVKHNMTFEVTAVKC